MENEIIENLEPTVEVTTPVLTEPVINIEAMNEAHLPLTVYEADGRIILSMMMCHVDRELNKKSREFYVEAPSNMNTQYVLDGEITDRPECPATLTGNILSGVPIGSTLTISGKDYEVTDDEDITLNFARPGNYKVNVKCWPYFDKTFELTK